MISLKKNVADQKIENVTGKSLKKKNLDVTKAAQEIEKEKDALNRVTRTDEENTKMTENEKKIENALNHQTELKEGLKNGFVPFSVFVLSFCNQ